MFEFLTALNSSIGLILGIIFILVAIFFLGSFVMNKPSKEELESISKNPALNKAVST